MPRMCRLFALSSFAIPQFQILFCSPNLKSQQSENRGAFCEGAFRSLSQNHVENKPFFSRIIPRYWLKGLFSYVLYRSISV